MNGEDDGNHRSPGPNVAGASILKWAGIAVILLAGLIWRLPADEKDWRFMLCENDSFYQLHRVEECLRHYPRVDAIDPYSHYPRGYRVHWMPLHTVFYASIARLSGIAAAEREHLVAVLSWAPPVLGLVALLLVLAIARSCSADRRLVLAIGLACALDPDVVRVFFYGTIDHHLFACLGVLAMVWGRLRARLVPWILGGFGLLALTPEGIIYVSILLGALFLSELAAVTTGAARDLKRPWQWCAAPAAAGFLAWWINRMLEATPLATFDLTWMYPTLFAPLWLAVLGASMVFATAWAGQSMASRGWRAAAIGAGAVIAAAAVFLERSGTLQTIMVRLLGGGGRLLVAEETSVFQQGVWATSAWYRILGFAAVFAFIELVASWRAARGARQLFQWVLFTAAYVLAFKEYRHLYVLAPLLLIALALAMVAAVKALQQLPLFSSGRRAWPAILVASAVLPFFVSESIAGRSGMTGNVCSALPQLEETAGWLQRNTPDPASSDGLGYGVFSAWSIGHHIHILGNRPTVVDPFNYDFDRWVDTALVRVWHARTADELMTALHGYNVRYLVLTNPVSEILDTLGGDDPPRSELVENGPNGSVTFRPAMSQFACFRLFMNGGFAPEFGQLQPRYFSHAAKQYTSNAGGVAHPVVIPRIQIFEVKPGARLVAQAPDGISQATISYVVRRNAAADVEITQFVVPVDARGAFTFLTSLPTPHQEEAFAVEAGYTVAVGDRSHVVEVTQDMVDTGALVSLDLSEPEPALTHEQIANNP